MRQYLIILTNLPIKTGGDEQLTVRMKFTREHLTLMALQLHNRGKQVGRTRYSLHIEDAHKRLVRF